MQVDQRQTQPQSTPENIGMMPPAAPAPIEQTSQKTDKLAIYQELYNRGEQDKIPAEKRAIADELVRRGAITVPGGKPAVAAPPQQSLTPPPPEEVPEPETSRMDNLIGGVRALASGASAGFTQPAEAALRSLFDPTQKREDVQAGIRKSANKFSEEHPLVDIGLNVVGAIASPLSKIGMAVKGVGLARSVIQNATAVAAQSAITAANTQDDPVNAAIHAAKTGGSIATAVGLAGGTLGKVGGAVMRGLEKMPGATVGQAIGGKIGEMTRNLEKLLSKSILGAPLRNAEARQMNAMREQFEKLNPAAKKEVGDFGEFMKRASQRAQNKISETQQNLYQKGVYSHLGNGIKSPASGENTAKYIDSIQDTLLPAQREFLEKNVIGSLTDPQGLNLAKLQGIKQFIGNMTAAPGAVFKNKDQAINGLYGALKKDFYDSSVRAAPQGVSGIVRKGLERADSFTTKYLKEGGIKGVLQHFSEATPEQFSSAVGKLVKATQEKTSDRFMINTLSRRLPKEDAEVFHQSIRDHLMNGPAANFTKFWEGMGQKTKELVFGKDIDTYQNMFNQLKSLKVPGLNPSGTAGQAMDIGLGTGGLGLAAGTGGGSIIPSIAAAGGAYGLSGILANPTNIAKAMKYNPFTTRGIQRTIAPITSTGE